MEKSGDQATVNCQSLPIVPGSIASFGLVHSKVLPFIQNHNSSLILDRSLIERTTAVLKTISDRALTVVYNSEIKMLLVCSVILALALVVSIFC